MLFTVYMLQCSDGTYYIGKTVDLEKRIRAHNGKLSGGAKYTRARRPVKVVYTEQASDGSVALKREYALKKLTRVEKEKLITLSINL